MKFVPQTFGPWEKKINLFSPAEYFLPADAISSLLLRLPRLEGVLELLTSLLLILLSVSLMLFVLGTVVGGGGADIMDDDAGVEDVAELTVEFEPGKYLKLETSTSIAKLAEL